MLKLHAAWLFVVLLGACEIAIPQGVIGCDADPECPTGWYCRRETNTCYAGSETDQSPAAGDPDAGDCKPVECYDGPEETRSRGQCRSGNQLCNGAEPGRCEAQVLPQEESCNGRDDDCDGRMDETCPCDEGSQLDCYTGPRETADRGRCQRGKQTCSGGLYGECEGERLPAAESCANPGSDDDCNGSVDDVPHLGDACTDDRASGACKQGTLSCLDGASEPSCVVAAQSGAETCNGLDDDCDGKSDETFDLNLDPAHCGSCDTNCGAGMKCCGGKCQLSEPPSNYAAACGGHCAPEGVVQCDGQCSKPDPAGYGNSCGTCGGTIQCDGSCSQLDPGDLGASCGNCGGTVQCGGSCSVPNPANLGAACDHCGGAVLCSGACSAPDPANFGAGCGSCGGTIACNAQCSKPDPSDLGASCGSCGGTINCNGVCSVADPENVGTSCGSCGGTITCGGVCSATDPPNIGTTCPDGTVLDCNITVCPCVTFCDSLGEFIPCKSKCLIVPDCLRPPCPMLP